MLYLPQILDLVNPVVIFHQEQSLHCLGVIEADRRRHAKSHLKVSTRLKLLWLIRRTSGLVGPSCNILSRIFFSTTCYPNRAHISALHHMALLGLFLPPYATASARCEPTSVELHQAFEGGSTDWATGPRLLKKNHECCTYLRDWLRTHDKEINTEKKYQEIKPTNRGGLSPWPLNQQ